MRKFVRPLLALSLATTFGLGAQAYAGTGYATDSYGSQLSYDSFNLSVRKRLESVRIGSVSQPFGRTTVTPDTYNYPVGPVGPVGAVSVGSDQAYAMTPSSRVASNSSYRRRQLDCVYYSGFTVWADLYQTWANQRSHGTDDGYRYRTFGPAVGFDWTSGGFTIGAATTYNWGKLKSKSGGDDRDLDTWALELFGQYNADLYYVNATLGYAHNRFHPSHSGHYSTNAWNIDAEFGYKFNFSGFQVTPHVGARYFHDRHGDISSAWGSISARDYYVFEVPVGVTLGYELNAGGMVFVPRARLGWTPELFRRKGRVNTWYGEENAARRGRNGFNMGLGVEARITQAISAHIDYNVGLRSRQHEHHLNFGAGFSF
jgi:outer membrane autotransporter protein